MARGNSRADSEYSNPFGEAKYAKGEKPKASKRSPDEILAQASGSPVKASEKPVKPEPKAKAEKAPKGDLVSALFNLSLHHDEKPFLDALPKEVTDTMGKRIRAGIETPFKALISFDPGGDSDDEDGDDSDRDVSSAEYWQDNKNAFMSMVDNSLKLEPIHRDDGAANQVKDAAGNVFKISSRTYETKDKINYSPKEWGQKTFYTLEVNGKTLKNWYRYEITGG